MLKMLEDLVVMEVLGDLVMLEGMIFYFWGKIIEFIKKIFLHKRKSKNPPEKVSNPQKL